MTPLSYISKNILYKFYVPNQTKNLKYILSNSVSEGKLEDFEVALSH